MSNVVKLNDYLKKNIKNHTSINLTSKLLKGTNSQDSKGLLFKNNNPISKNCEVKDYKSLFKYYLNSYQDILPSKKIISQDLNISISTLKNWNKILKEEGKIKNDGKQIYILRGE